MPVAQEPAASDQDHTRPEIRRDLARVFLMINSFETGGSERQFVSLARSLDPGRFALSLGCIQTKGPLRELVGDVQRFKLGGSVYGWKSWHSRWQLARHLRQQKVQIAHSFDFYSNLTLVLAARWSRVPVIIGSQRQLGDLLTPAQRRLQRLAFRSCDAVVCNSQAAAVALKSEGFPESKIRVIGNAISLDDFVDATPRLPRIPGVPRIGMIARMNAYDKNHRGFLGAAAKLHDLFPEMEFVLAGDGPLRREFESSAASLGIADKVKFLGNRQDIPAVLASIDITVVPSESESLSNVILESMAAGVPVIATRVGGNPELVDAGRGMLVPSKDMDALANAVAQLLNAPEVLRSMSSAGRQFARQFSTESVTQQYENLYQELLSRKEPAEVHITPKRSSSPLRVAIVAPSLKYVGGQAVQADLLLKHWSGDPDLQISFIPVDPQFPRGLGWLRRVPGLRTIVRTPFYLAALWRGLRDADIAHLFSASYSSFLVAPLPAFVVARLRGKKVLINYRSGEARDHLHSSRTARAVLRRADRVVSPSGFLADVFREFGISAAVVPNIVDLTQFSYRERRPLRPHLVCTRGFHRYYCIDVVVKAFALVQKEFPNAQLDLVGGGTLEPEIRQLVAELNIPGVTFCGVASRNEIGKYYDRSDIFINASRLDNMPVSVLEAYASGTPVITTAPEGMRYVVEDGRTGLLSEPGDAHALAANVLRILRDSDLASRLAANGFDRVRQYRWELVREQWLEIYRGLLPAKVARST